jgi:hypothetical protein
VYAEDENSSRWLLRQGGVDGHYVVQLFKWNEQHLRIKAFFGTSVNAVKIQIWIAISIYGWLRSLKKRLCLDPSLYEILQVLSLSLFGKKPILRAFDELTSEEKYERISNQLNLWSL